MKIDLNDFIVNKEFIQKTVLEKKEDLEQKISILSLTTYVPIIVVVFYVAEALNWPEKLLNKIDNLIKFYDYEEILNIPETCPRKFK